MDSRKTRSRMTPQYHRRSRRVAPCVVLLSHHRGPLCTNLKHAHSLSRIPSAAEHQHQSRAGGASLASRSHPATRKLTGHKYEINKLDLLQIDAEGYDFELLKIFPFSKVTPRIIHFEHLHLNETDRDASLKFLHNLGYYFVLEYFDITAVHKN